MLAHGFRNKLLWQLAFVLRPILRLLKHIAYCTHVVEQHCWLRCLLCVSPSKLCTFYLQCSGIAQVFAHIFRKIQVWMWQSKVITVTIPSWSGHVVLVVIMSSEGVWGMWLKKKIHHASKQPNEVKKLQSRIVINIDRDINNGHVCIPKYIEYIRCIITPKCAQNL